MNISYKWLKRYINFSLTPEQLAAALTSLGLECDTVEEVETIRGGLRGIVIGKVLTCVEHPNSDHLHITTCDLGSGEPVQIVCGAPNVAAGQTVVVATVGTTLYDGDKEFQIKKSKIRGVESFGMICAEDEIGIGAGHDGIMVLPDDAAAPGTPAADYFSVESDFCLEVELTPNRVDGASHYGVARDLKAWLRRHGEKDAEVMTASVADFTPDSAEGAATVTVDDTAGCPRYSGVTVRGVTVGESPEWLKNLLLATGQRPINNIVDITNFILLGLGQPLHCFDLAKVTDEHIVVRTCPAGTKFTTLDGKEHELDEADMMICDPQKPLAIAGVFGGLESGVTESTSDVFIESAWFNPTRVRKTARRHGLNTDASFRYERGTDPAITTYAAKLAALLIKELAGGEICGDVVDIYPSVAEPFAVEFSLDYCNRLIGKEIPAEDVEDILRSLDITIAGRHENTLDLLVPRYRVDVQRPCDIVEEILRVYGYNNVEISDAMHATLSLRTSTDESYRLQELISSQLSGQGFREIMNNSLTAVSYYADNEVYPLDRCISLMNPLSQDLGVMRQTLLYGGLESIAHNINRRSADLRLYEFGNVYFRDPAKESSKEKPLAPFSEGMRLGIWLTGNFRNASWNSTAEKASIFDLKAIVEGIFHRLCIPGGLLVFNQKHTPIYSAALEISTRDGHHLATLGIVRRDALKKFDIEQDVCYAEIAWPEIMRLTLRSNTQYTDVPRTQPVVRDLALLLDNSVTFEQVEACVRASERKLLRGVSLFDVYEGEHLPEGKKSYAITITLQDNEKTLQDKQIEAVMQKITTNLGKQLGASLR